MKLTALIIAIILCLVQPLAAAQSGQDLLLLYSNDVLGETEPCG